MELVVADLVININKGHFLEYLQQFLRNLLRIKKPIEQVVVISEADISTFQGVINNTGSKVTIIQIAGFLDFILKLADKKISWIRKWILLKLLFFCGGTLSYVCRILRFRSILKIIQPQQCIFTYVSSFVCFEIPLLLGLDFLFPVKIHYLLIYHAIPYFSVNGGFKKVYQMLLIRLYKRLALKRKVTILSHSDAILTFFKDLKFEIKKISYNEVERQAEYRSLTPIEAKRQLGFSEDVPIILFFGVLSGRIKNLHGLIQAFDSISCNGQLIIASEPIDLSYYQEIIRLLKTVKHKERFVCKWYKIPS